ncbi:MAG: DUF4145 domain-containing protein [Pyrinomonadaceae bacterium]
MPRLLQTTLDLERCPHCGVDKPNLQFRGQFQQPDFQGAQRFWRVYACSRCGGIVSARASNWDQDILELHPTKNLDISVDIPERARSFLLQAIESTRSPSGAVMLAASAVDAMLKAKNLRTGGLYERINLAAGQHLIPAETAEWAHDIRLNANDQRHADENAPLPTTDDARRVIEFALALAQFVFVLPARVQRGRQNAQQVTTTP